MGSLTLLLSVQTMHGWGPIEARSSFKECAVSLKMASFTCDPGADTPYTPTICSRVVPNWSVACMIRPLAKWVLTLLRWQAMDWCMRIIVPPGRVRVWLWFEVSSSICSTSFEVGPKSGNVALGCRWI